MDNFLDRVWEVIYSFLNNTIMFLDALLSPFEFFGPGAVIFFLAFLAICTTRIISKFYVTKRYIRLEKEYRHWRGVREEAMKYPDREKGKTLAKNIDQAELNKAYYDYFFEGLLKHFMGNVLPILLMVSYVTSVYTPETLLERFGTKWVFSFSLGSSFHVDVSSLFWFVLCLLPAFILIAVLKKVYKIRYAKKILV